MGALAVDGYLGDQISHLKDYGKHKRLNLRSVKLYADGRPFLL